MTANNTIATLRDHLFAQLDILADTSKPVDLDRCRQINVTAENIINSARVEVELASVLRGAVSVPFIEGQAEERPALPPAPAPTPEQRLDKMLHGNDNHPWRHGHRNRERGR